MAEEQEAAVSPEGGKFEGRAQVDALFPLPDATVLATEEGRRRAAGRLLQIANREVHGILYPVDEEGEPVATSDIEKLAQLWGVYSEIGGVFLTEAEGLRNEDMGRQPVSWLAYEIVKARRDQLEITMLPEDRDKAHARFRELQVEQRATRGVVPRPDASPSAPPNPGQPAK